MNRGKKPLLGSKSNSSGYTILETLIFLAVSGALFVSAMALVEGQQSRAEFKTAVREFEASLRDVANDVSSGYYQGGGNVKCVQAANRPQFSAPGVVGQGESIDCIFVGRVVKLNQNSFDTYSLAGLRQVGGVNVTNLVDARPQVVEYSGGSGLIVNNSLKFGVGVECVAQGATCNPVSDANAALAFIGSLNGDTVAGASGQAIRTELRYNTVSINSNQSDTITALNTGGAAGFIAPVNGMTICLSSGGTRQYALMHFGGGAASGLTISSEIKSFSGASPTCS